MDLCCFICAMIILSLVIILIVDRAKNGSFDGMFDLD